MTHPSIKHSVERIQREIAMRGKLTRPQMDALRALVDRPATITTWGGKPMGGMPPGIRSRATVDALYRQGLVSVRHNGLKVTWSVTPIGRAALDAGA